MDTVGQNSFPKFSRLIVEIFCTCLVAHYIIFILHKVDKYFGIKFKKSISTVTETKGLSFNMRFF
jgi:hypothetical protein